MEPPGCAEHPVLTLSPLGGILPNFLLLGSCPPPALPPGAAGEEGGSLVTLLQTSL